MLLGVDRIYDRGHYIEHHSFVAIRLGLGSQTFDDNFKFWDWIVIIAASIALIWMQLNFLISLIKETFDEFIAEREYKDRDEKVKIILGFDRLCHIKYRKPKYKYF